MVGREKGNLGKGIEWVRIGNGEERKEMMVGIEYEMRMEKMIVKDEGEEIIGIGKGKIGVEILIRKVGKKIGKRIKRMIVEGGKRKLGK